MNSSSASSLSIKFKDENTSHKEFLSNQSSPKLKNKKVTVKEQQLQNINGAYPHENNYALFTEENIIDDPLMNFENGKISRVILIPSFADNIMAISLYVLSGFLYALAFVIQKFFFAFLINASYGQQTVIKGVVMMAINSYLIKKNKEIYVFDTSLNILLAKRIFFGAFGEFILLLSMNYLRINTASVFSILPTVVACLVSSYFSGEVVKTRDIIVAASCFASATLIVKPFFGEGQDTFIGILMGLTVCTSYTSAIISQKMIGYRVTINVINFYFGVCFIILGYIIFFYQSSNWDYSIVTLICHTAFGVMSYFSIITAVQAVIMGKLSYVMPFGNTNVVFAILMGYFILGEKVDILDVTGTFLVLGICVYRSVLIILEEKTESNVESN
jgi:drug/metabolite transporter (DMT)-like permease